MLLAFAFRTCQHSVLQGYHACIAKGGHTAMLSSCTQGKDEMAGMMIPCVNVVACAVPEVSLCAGYRPHTIRARSSG